MYVPQDGAPFTGTLPGWWPEVGMYVPQDGAPFTGTLPGWWPEVGMYVHRMVPPSLVPSLGGGLRWGCTSHRMVSPSLVTSLGTWPVSGDAGCGTYTVDRRGHGVRYLGNQLRCRSDTRELYSANTVQKASAADWPFCTEEHNEQRGGYLPSTGVNPANFSLLWDK